MRVEELLRTDFPHLYETESIDSAIDDLVEHPVHSLPVFDDDDRFIGELSQNALLLEIVGSDELEGDFDLTSVQHLMSSGAETIEPMINRHELTLRPDDHVLEAVDLMYEEDLGTLPVVDANGELVGILTDIAILEHYDELS